MKIDRRLLEPSTALRLVSASLVRGHRNGERRSIYRGRGVEFADFRPYAEGDDLRVVDWNVYARLGQLVVRLFHEDRVLGVRVILDCSGSMGSHEGEKANYGANLAAVLAMVALQHRDPVQLILAGGETNIPPINGHDMRRMPRFLEVLERAEPAGLNALSQSLKGTQQRNPKDVAVVISDGLWAEGARVDCLKALAGSGQDALLLHVLGREELNPTLEHGQIVVDAETQNRERIRWDSAARAEYQRHLKQWCAQISDDCRRLGINYVPCWTHVPVLDVLAHRQIAGAAS